MAPRAPEPDARQSDRGYDEATLEGEPYEDEAYGEVIEVPAGETVDGDLNGAPELAALHESQQWEGTDALDALHGADAEERRNRSIGPVAERCRTALERRRDQALERLELARPGLTEPAETAPLESEASDPREAPDEIETSIDLEEQLARIDRALERVESREYGRCLRCGERIAPALLSDEPERELCERCGESR